MGMGQALARNAALAACLVVGGAAAGEGRLILPTNSGDSVEAELARGLQDRAPTNVVRVYVGSPKTCCAGRSPIAGSYSVDGQRVVFAPSFDFIEGQTYTVVLDNGEGTPTRTAFTPGGTEVPTTPEVLAIYPSGPDIPENTLRFYIEFAAPMAPHRANEFIRLVDDKGAADSDAFMSFTQELWNPDRTRLTLLMDPGRIKRGVAQNLALGPALEAGGTFSIVVNGGWPGAQGVAETERFARTFGVSAPLRTLPDPDRWIVSAPKVATRESLEVTFDRPFDQQLAQTAIRVLGSDGVELEGTVRLGDHETRWVFEPALPWPGEAIKLVVDARLEDVAGNNFRDLLDHAVGTDLRAINHIELEIPLGQ